MKKMLKEEDIVKIIQEKLPELIEKYPVLRLKIEEIIEKKAVTKEEIKEILLELKRQREETSKRFEAVDKRFEELIKEMNKGFELLRNAITAVGARWGIYSEEAFREGMKDILEELGFPYYEIKKWETFDEEGFVYGYPSSIEVDLLIKDKKHYLIEIKSSVSSGDVLEFKKIGELYEKKTNIKPELIIISPHIREEAKEKCNIFKIKYYKK